MSLPLKVAQSSIERCSNAEHLAPERCLGQTFTREELAALARAELAALGAGAPCTLRLVLEAMLEEGWAET